MKKQKFLILLSTLLLLFSLGVSPKVAQASTYPTFSITSVEKGVNVTIYTYNMPAGKQFKVLMGEFGTLGIGGINVATIDTGAGGSFYGTFLIPDALKDRLRVAIRLEGIDTVYYAYNWFWNNTGGGTDPVTPPGYTGIPTFSVLSVVKDTSVTIKAYNFPASTDFKVLMGKMWTQGIGGIEVTTFNSGAGGGFEATYNIPAALAGEQRIAIRLESSTGYYYAYNWFWNNPSGTTPIIPGYTGIPTFSIKSVVTDSSVTILTNNFPQDLEFKVLMGKMWTQGVGGIHVATINSGTGGSFESTFDIPAALAGEQRIAIRLEATNGYFAYNWFWNNTTSGTVTPPSGYTGIPTFNIQAVVKDSTVTIKAYNFPPGLDFNVRMGLMWTQGIGGELVEVFNSGAGGNFEATYNIPAALYGQQRISVRVESPSGYYAYNWFWNNTYP